MPIPTKIAFEQRYSDDSGVEYGVRYNADRSMNEIEFEAVIEVTFPVEQLDWLIDSLQTIRDTVRTTPAGPQAMEGDE